METKKMAAVIGIVAILSAFIFVVNAASTPTANTVAEQPTIEETSTAGTCSMTGCGTSCSKCGGSCGSQCAANGGCGCGCGK